MNFQQLLPLAGGSNIQTMSNRSLAIRRVSLPSVRCPPQGSDYALGAHTASLGLAITTHSGLPGPFSAGAFVGQHGSWNRCPPSGYRVIFIPFVNGKPDGDPVDVLTGFLNADGKARGRPVGVALDSRGGLTGGR